ncbi:MAG: SUMF1/EgtB/PvdO family nonheme iron enzyme [Deltaproteobacteria bacterium]|nr:SUMF1/EgtB/PvdO family nonheme iron enzyme [Deltaproteobacteria bacterium]
MSRELDLTAIFGAAKHSAEGIDPAALEVADVLVPVRLCDRMRDLGQIPPALAELTEPLESATPECLRRAFVLERALDVVDLQILATSAFAPVILSLAKERDECVIAPGTLQYSKRLELLVRSLVDALGARPLGESLEAARDRLSSLGEALRPRVKRRILRARPPVAIASQSEPPGFSWVTTQGRSVLVPRQGPFAMWRRANVQPELARLWSERPAPMFLPLECARDGSWLEAAPMGMSLADLAKRGLGVDATGVILRTLCAAARHASDAWSHVLELDPHRVWVSWGGAVLVASGDAEVEFRAPDREADQLASSFSLGAVALYSVLGEAPFASEADRLEIRYSRPGAVRQEAEPLDDFVARTLAPRARRLDLAATGALLHSAALAAGTFEGLGRTARQEAPDRYVDDGRFLARAVRTRMGLPASPEHEDMIWVAYADRDGGFLIDRSPVTQERYAEFVYATRRQPPPNWPSGGPARRNSAAPVTHVSYGDCDSFAEWCRKRLPSAEQIDRAIAVGLEWTGQPLEWTRDFSEPRVSKWVRGPSGREPRSDRAGDLGFRCVVEP